MTRAETDWLTERFQENQARLRALAYRMLGSAGEAEDAVQEAWLRLTRSDTERVENPGGWLTTVVGRVCLDMLRSRKSRREEPLDAPVAGSTEGRADRSNQETDLILADSMGPALLLVLDTLTPIERVAFVLHDLFDLPFADIAPIIGRTEAATRQLASRARRRVRGKPALREADASRQREVVAAFLAASRDGDFAALVELLDPDVRLHADSAAVQAAAANRASGAPPLLSAISGAHDVAEVFSGRARAAQLALVDGVAGAVWAPGGVPRVAFVFTLEGDTVVEIEVVMEPSRLGNLDLQIVNE